MLLATWALAMPAVSQAQNYFAEAPVNLAITVQRTSDPTVTGPDANGIRVEETTIVSRVLTNADVLAAMKSQGLIPSTTDFTLVAIWATWPDADPFMGSSYRFYVRKNRAKNNALQRVPSSILSLTPLDWVSAARHGLAPKIGRTGTETYLAYAELKFAFTNASGTLLGENSGGGSYQSPVKLSPTLYLPAASTFDLHGTASGGYASAKLNLSVARFIPKNHFTSKSLPAKTVSGSNNAFGTYVFAGSLLKNSGGYDFRPLQLVKIPVLHYFLPLSADLLLSREVALTPTTVRSTNTVIQTTRLSQDDFIRGALAKKGITDASGWALYLHKSSYNYAPDSDFDLALGHADGRIFSIEDIAISSRSASYARTSRHEYRDTVHLTGQDQLLSSLTHEKIWPLGSDQKLRLTLNGRAVARDTFGSIPELGDTRDNQPGAGQLQLFGTYERIMSPSGSSTTSTTTETGLARVNFTYTVPLPQADLPSDWSLVYLPYVEEWRRKEVTFSDINTLSGSNIYTGGITVSGGTLRVGNYNALGSGSSNLNTLNPLSGLLGSDGTLLLLSP